MSLPNRIAALLDWGATNMPERPIEFTKLAKIVLILHRTPTEKEDKTKLVKSALRRAKPILMEKYRRGLASHPGFGIRATSSPDDTVSTQITADARRAASSMKALDRSCALVKTSEVVDKDLRARLSGINGVRRLLVSNNVLDKLLPEKSEE